MNKAMNKTRSKMMKPTPRINLDISMSDIMGVVASFYDVIRQKRARPRDALSAFLAIDEIHDSDKSDMRAVVSLINMLERTDEKTGMFVVWRVLLDDLALDIGKPGTPTGASEAAAAWWDAAADTLTRKMQGADYTEADLRHAAKVMAIAIITTAAPEAMRDAIIETMEASNATKQ